MDPTEYSSKAPHSTGLFAVLGDRHRGKGNGARSGTARVFAALVLALLSLLALAPAGAEAGQARLFAGTFGCAEGMGGCTTADPYPLQMEIPATDVLGPHSLAVDTAPGPSQGDVYVTDTANHRVEKFNSKGEFLLMFGKEVNKTKVGEPGASEEEKDVCTEAEVVSLLEHVECQSGAAASTPGALEEPTFIAVDNSSGESKGDVYVDTGSGTEAQNELQQLELTNATGGTFTLTFEGETTTPISVQSENIATSIQNALQALPALAGNVLAQGQSQSGGTFQLLIGFTGNLEDTNVPQMTVNASALTPSGATASVSTLREGGLGTPDVITKFTEDGQLVSSWGNGGQLDGSAAPEGPLLGLGGIAVDPSGNLWTIDSFGGAHTSFARAFEFKQDGGFLAGWSAPVIGISAGAPRVGVSSGGLAVDSEDDLYFETQEGLLKYSATGALLGSIVNRNPAPGVEHSVESYAVDSSNDDLFVTVGTTIGGVNEPGEVQRYLGSDCKPSGLKSSCSPAESFGADRLPFTGGHYTGVAVDPSSSAHSIYVLGNGSGEATAFAIETVPDVVTVKASGFTATTAVLNGTVNPSGEALTGCFFEWGETEAYGEKAPCSEGLGASQGEIGKGTAPVEVHANIAGLASGHTYHFRLVATNKNTDLAEEPSRGSDLSFGPPLIESGSALSVAATSATLQLQVNPNDVDTHARIEYGTQAGVYPYATPAADLGAAGSVQSQTFDLQGLEPGTTYYYRVSAESVLGSPRGLELAFTTQSTTAAAVLPDGRGYELVSPADKHGVQLEPDSGFAGGGALIQAAAGGEGIAYSAHGSIGIGASGNRSVRSSQLLATRGPAGWSSVDVSTPHREPAGFVASENSEYQLFSSDLSLAVVEPAGATPLSPEASEKTPYLREADGSYTPLVYPGDIPAGTKFGGSEKGPEVFEKPVSFVTGTPDLSHVLINSPMALTAVFAEGFESKDENVYEWGAGVLRLVSEVPPTSAAACGGAGPACRPASEAGLGSAVGNEDWQVRDAISSDGSSVVFKSSSGKFAGLYLRDLAREQTIRLDAPEPKCSSCKAGSATFEDASADDSRVFFTDDGRLTAGSTAATAEPDLYMCQVEVDEEGNLACALTDLTANAVNPAEPANVLGAVIGASEDGQYVYFVANGVLTSEGAPVPGAVRGNCSRAGVAEHIEGFGECNLYRYDIAGKTTKLIAVLSGADFPDWAPESHDLGELTARVSPNGRYLAFMSERPLTGYDNRDAVSGERDEEVFLYDSEAEGGKGRLVCASCDPTGARPAGVKAPVKPPRDLFDTPGNWSERWVAASVPGWSKADNPYALYQSRYLSNSGRLFFNSNDPLVPQDTNGTGDVYEFEPPNSELEAPPNDSCEVTSSTYSPRSGGCVSLISSGISKEESSFIDASETGDDVFFLTASRLTTKDVDSAYDIYDARVGGGETEPSSPPACEGDACQSPVAAPDDPTPGSLTFQGPGNLGGGASNPPPGKAIVKKVTKKTVKCGRGHVKKKGKCVKVKKRAKKAKRVDRASNDRRTSR